MGYQVRAIFNIRQYDEEGLLMKINEKYFNGVGRVDSGGVKDREFERCSGKCNTNIRSRDLEG